MSTTATKPKPDHAVTPRLTVPLGAINSKQQCVTWTLGGEISHDGLMGITAISGFGGSVKFTASESQQYCTMVASQNTFTWNDKGRHALWT
jgi:hypothetical protein